MSPSQSGMSSPQNREEALFQAAAQLTGTERATLLDAACLIGSALRQPLVTDPTAAGGQQNGHSGQEQDCFHLGRHRFAGEDARQAKTAPWGIPLTRGVKARPG